MKTKIYWALGLTCLSLLSCAPKDQLVENPFYTSPTAEGLEFQQLFAENDQILSGDIALFTSDRLAEAARMLEFALNADAEVEAYKKELAILESGGRARSFVLCRKLKAFSRLQGSKTYSINWDGCKDSRSGFKTESEVRGPEDYHLEFAMPGVALPSLVEAETGDGLTLKLSELDESGKRVRGSRGDLTESRSMRSQLIDVDQKVYEFTYRSVTSHEVIRSKGKFKGVQDNGEISSIIEGRFQLKEIPGGRLVVDKYLQAKNDSLSTTVKATRKDIAGKVKDKFYIMINDLTLDSGETQVNVPGGTTSIMVPTGTNPDGSVILDSQKLKFCGQFRSQFTSKTMWLTGSPRNRSNRVQETINFGDDDIVLQSEAGNRSLGRCLKRTDIAPIVNRDRFYF